jgi:16S rRNA (cytidine1402-2'-O)-methyltransferase
LHHYGIETKLQSHHKFNEHKTSEHIAERILGGETIALITDAGTPGISDPGFLLVRTCAEKGVDIETLPGATAFVPALVNSALPCVTNFVSKDSCPRKRGARKD